MAMTSETPTRPSGTAWNIGLWAAQIALAGLYGMAAYVKIAMFPAELVGIGIIWAESAPLWMIRFIGFAELAGVLGLILPALTRIRPALTAHAATGLLAIQVLAIAFHLFRGEAEALPINFIYVALSLLVIWGRTQKAPIAPRA